MKMFSDCSGECCVCFCGDGCLAGHGDDDFIPASKEKIIDNLENNRYPRYREYMIKYLKENYGIDYKPKKEIKKERNKKIKPCPFCGGKARKQKLHFCADMQFDDDHDKFWIECGECGAKSKVIHIRNARYRKTCREEFELAEKQAVEAWNRRCCE